VPAVTYIFYPGGTGNPVTLGDDAVGDRIAGGEPVAEPTTQSVKMAGAQFPVQLEHGNLLQSRTWRVERDHLTLDAAVLFMQSHAQGLPVILGIAQGKLQVLLDDGTTYFCQNCTRPKARCLRWDGQSTVYEYTVQHGQMTDTYNPV
jgi:hypothetical protein